MKKQRPLTKIQMTVLRLKLLGNDNEKIAQVLGIHPDTVSHKYSDIRKGMAKGAYNNLPPEVNLNGDLFESVSA